MKKCVYYLGLTFILMFCFCVDVAFASSGALKKNSIKTCPNGVTYGYHGSDNHWHVAESSNASSGWSAVGEPLSGDPCPNGGGSSSQNTTKRTTTTTTTTNVPSTTTTTSTTTVSSSTTTTVINSGIKKIIVNDKDIGKISNEMSYVIHAKTITISIVLFNSLSTYDIEGEMSNFELGEERTFLIKVNETNGEYNSYLLNIKREQGITDAKLKSLLINGSEKSLDSTIEYTLLNWENSITFEYELYDNNVKINFYQGKDKLDSLKDIAYDSNNNHFTIELVDENDNVRKYYVIINKKSLVGSLFVVLIIVSIFVLPIYLIYRFIKNKRNKNNNSSISSEDNSINNKLDIQDNKGSFKNSSKEKTFPKVGFRIPSITKRLKANTTGKITRKVKNSINPFYGMKGMGFLKNPKRSLKNKIYHKTTFGIKGIFK